MSDSENAARRWSAAVWRRAWPQPGPP